jgi:hypothetical protein
MSADKVANRRLSDAERVVGHRILESVRDLIEEASIHDKSMGWALRRFVYTRLMHDERGKPMQRRILKLNKMISQRGLCFECGEELPKRGAELDRIQAMDGYTEENTHLVCHKCHRKSQEERGFV